MGNVNTLVGNPPGNQPVAQWVTAPTIMDIAVSGTNTYNSGPIPCGNKLVIGLQVTFVGTMTGTFQVNVTNNAQIVGDPLTFSPSIVGPTGSNLEFSINLTQIGFPYFNLSYTNASGSGTLTITQSAKDMG